MRRVITESIPTGNGFDPTVALTIDAREPTTVQAIPYRSFCRPVQGEPGILYYFGSLHSNYPGNEIDRIDLTNLASTVITTTISHQPRVPPQGVESGYGSGSGQYVYRQYGAPLADGSDWQPYAHHTWTKNSWHPTWGFVSQGVYALADGATTGANPAGSGSGYQQSSMTQGLWGYDFAVGKFKVRMPTATGPNFAAQGPGISGMSDWNQHRSSLVGLANYGGYTYVTECIGTNATKTDLFNINSATVSGNTWGFYDHTSGNGMLCKWLEGSRHLVVRADGNKAPGDPVSFKAYNTIFILDLAATAPAQRAVRIDPPAAALTGINPHGDGNVTFTIDRNSRRIAWAVYRNLSVAGQVQTLRFFWSTFDDPWNWTEINSTGLPPIVHQDYQAGWLASCREPLHFYNGHLFIVYPNGAGSRGINSPGYCDGALDLWRAQWDAGVGP